MSVVLPPPETTPPPADPANAPLPPPPTGRKRGRRRKKRQPWRALRASLWGVPAGARAATVAARAAWRRRAAAAVAARLLRADYRRDDLAARRWFRRRARRQRFRRLAESLELLVDAHGTGTGGESVPDAVPLRAGRCAALSAHPQSIQRAGEPALPTFRQSGRGIQRGRDHLVRLSPPTSPPCWSGGSAAVRGQASWAG